MSYDPEQQDREEAENLARARQMAGLPPASQPGTLGNPLPTRGSVPAGRPIYAPQSKRSPREALAARLGGWTTALYVIASLTALGALFAGVALMTHVINSCDESIDSCTSDANLHPFVGVGAAVLVGGLVQAIFLFAVAEICGGMKLLLIGQTTQNGAQA